MSKVLIDRELLERIAKSGMEVVAWQDAENPLYTTGEKRQMHGWATDGYPVVELCRLSDAQRAIAERDATIERLEAGIPRLQEHAHQMRQQRDRLRAENERLRKSCAGVIARSVHQTRAATNSTLDGYLAAGIAATDAELDTLRQKIAEIDPALVAKNHEAHDLEIDNRQLRTQLAEARELLTRYRKETPIGYQPHMIAHIADAWLEANHK